MEAILTAAALPLSFASIHTLVMRVVFALRLLLAVVRLPAAALPAASRLGSEDVGRLLWGALLRSQGRSDSHKTASAVRRRERAFVSSGGSGGDETPCSDDAGVLSDCLLYTSPSPRDS